MDGGSIYKILRLAFEKLSNVESVECKSTRRSKFYCNLRLQPGYQPLLRRSQQETLLTPSISTIVPRPAVVFGVLALRAILNSNRQLKSILLDGVPPRLLTSLTASSPLKTGVPAISVERLASIRHFLVRVVLSFPSWTSQESHGAGKVLDLFLQDMTGLNYLEYHALDDRRGTSVLSPIRQCHLSQSSQLKTLHLRGVGVPAAPFIAALTALGPHLRHLTLTSVSLIGTGMYWVSIFEHIHTHCRALQSVAFAEMLIEHHESWYIRPEALHKAARLGKPCLLSRVYQYLLRQFPCSPCSSPSRYMHMPDQKTQLKLRWLTESDDSFWFDHIRWLSTLLDRETRDQLRGDVAGLASELPIVPQNLQAQWP